MEGRRLSHYRLIERLGGGSMGEVYRAVDERLEREVALKMLPPAQARDLDRQARLLDEAKAASALNHPGIVTLHDVGAAGGQTFLVMELVHGERFSQLAGKISWREAARLCASVADALEAAHTRKILHRDVKSDNLMRTAGGVKVLDFGLAARHHAPAVTRSAPVALPDDLGLAQTIGPGDTPAPPSSSSGQIVGTPSYMAPEQATGAATVRSEIFSLGVVLHELLAGRRPFDRGTAAATIQAILDEEPPPLRGFPARLQRIVARALAKRAEDRFASMAEFAAALRVATHRRGLRAAFAALVVALLAGGATFVATRPRAARREPAPVVTGTRRLTFEAGCEEYPSFVAGTRSIVFDGLVDGDYEIEALDLDTGARRRLTTSPGWDYGASPSPDGKLVAYVHGGETARRVFVVPFAGGDAIDRGAIPEGRPAWTNDGELLVAGGDSDVLVRGPDGSERRAFTLPPGGTLQVARELDGGDFVVTWYPAATGDDGLVAEVLGGRFRALDGAVTDNQSDVVLSPDRRAYYLLEHGLSSENVVVRRRPGGARQTGVPGGISPSGGLGVAADGKSLVFSTCRERSSLVRLRPGEAPVPITNGAWRDRAPSVLGERIFFTSTRESGEQPWVLDMGSGAERKLATLTGGAPVPSPDGTRFVMADFGGRIWVAPVGGEVRALTGGHTDSAPAFLDDDVVAFERDDPGEPPSIWTISAAGGEPSRLAAGSAPLSAAAGVIAFSDGHGHIEIADRTGATRSLPGGLDGLRYSDVHLSRDGRRLLGIARNRELYDVALDGKSPPRLIFSTSAGALKGADYAPDDDGAIAALSTYDGDLFLADGSFP
jgi:Tol biopolymer transport system component